jgi:hypothetical protein
VHFEARVIDHCVELFWKTSTEVNNYGFEIERFSMNNQQSTPPKADAPLAQMNNWAQAGFVEGSGTTNSPREYSFTEKNLFPGKYSYRLKQIDRNGNFKYTEAVTVEIFVPSELTLTQNYPNPFNPSTTIEFTLPDDGRVSLKVYDMLGKVVATLVDGELEAGTLHRATFDASNISSGIYFFRLEHKDKQLMKKLLVMK